MPDDEKNQGRKEALDDPMWAMSIHKEGNQDTREERPLIQDENMSNPLRQVA